MWWRTDIFKTHEGGHGYEDKNKKLKQQREKTHDIQAPNVHDFTWADPEYQRVRCRQQYRVCFTKKT